MTMTAVDMQKALEDKAAIFDAINGFFKKKPLAARALSEAIKNAPEIGSIHLSFRDGGLHSVTVERVTY